MRNEERGGSAGQDESTEYLYSWKKHPCILNAPHPTSNLAPTSRLPLLFPSFLHRTTVTKITRITYANAFPHPIINGSIYLPNSSTRRPIALKVLYLLLSYRVGCMDLQASKKRHRIRRSRSSTCSADDGQCSTRQYRRLEASHVASLPYRILRGP